MDPFPVEIWIQIIQNLEKRDWLVLSTTCHVLSAIAQAMLFQDVRIHPRAYMSGDSAVQSMMRLTQSPAGGQPLACLVRTLTLWLHARLARNGWSSMHQILSQLPSFASLKHLKINGFHIDSDGCTAIHSLTQLKSLTLVFCTIDSVLSKRTPGSFVSKLTISGPKSAQGWIAFASFRLQSLILKLEFDDRSIGAEILSSFATRGASKSLTHLEWNDCNFSAQVIETLQLFLRLSPQIRILSLGYSEPVKEIPTDAIPNLVHFSGSAEDADIFIRGRPVNSAALRVRIDTPFEVLGALRLSSVPVTRLELYPSMIEVDVESMLQHVPATLHYLKWQHQMAKEDLRPWRSALLRMTDLRVLEFGKVSFRSCRTLDPNPKDIAQAFSTESLPQDIVWAFSEACPSLREVIFPFSGKYTRRNDGSWEGYYPS